MRQFESLTREELMTMVHSIWDYLYVDIGENGEQHLNLDKDLSGADFIEAVSLVFSQHSLTPSEDTDLQTSEPPDAIRYVLYDLDMGCLLSTEVFDSPTDAADVAARCNDVLILPLRVEEARSSGGDSEDGLPP